MERIKIISRSRSENLYPLQQTCYVGDCFDANTPNLSDYSWSDVKTKMERELDRVLRNPLKYPVAVDLFCHNSFAYLAGVKFRSRLMEDARNLTSSDVKLCNATGNEFTLQKTTAEMHCLPIEIISFGDNSIKTDSVAIVLEIGQGKEALSKVRDYVEKTRITQQIIRCKFDGIVENDSFIAIYNTIIEAASSYSTIHLFGFSPVQIFFALGAQWRHMKIVHLYEYINTNYEPSFRIN